MTPVKQGVTVWQEDFGLTSERSYCLSGKMQRQKFSTDLSKCQIPQHMHTEIHTQVNFLFHICHKYICLHLKSDILLS